ncbi:hypothetical protein ACQW02_12670 [Humitalea sp. 24SJ18S-53]|uniref:hypothetical protein n=1 Tax=Humitalea sp. 24SJ18S-53 TaxID=3422307 RepID=UPI003D67A576
MQGLRFEPSDEQRRLVHAMAGFGIPQADIATHLKVDAKTLRLHFREELDRGSIDATAKVAQSLFHMATAGKNVAAAIFWMKARAGWREKHQVEVTGADGAPLQPLVIERIIIDPRDGGRRPTIEGEADDIGQATLEAD